MRTVVGELLTAERGSNVAHSEAEIQRQLEATCTTVHTLLEDSPVGLAFLDRDLRLEFVSPALAELTGTRAGEHRGSHVVDVLPGYGELALLAARVRDSGVASFDQDIAAEHQGEMVASCYPIRAGDQIVGVGCLIESASRRRDAREIIVHAPIPIVVFDGVDHRLRLANVEWRRMFGYGGPNGQPAREVLAQLIDSAVIAQMDLVYATGAPAAVTEIPFRVDPEGVSLPQFYCAAIRCIRNSAGTITGVMVICADVTDEVVTRRLLADVLHTLLWSGIADHPADYYNRRWRDYTGIATDTLRLGGWQQVIHADDQSRCLIAFTEAARQRHSTDVEARVRRADGRYRWHRVRFEIPDDDRHVTRWFGSAVDIDDLRHAELERIEILARERAARADAEQANRLKDQFLAVVSHELRAPITTLLLWENLLREAPSDPDIRARALDAIHQSAIAQSRLVADLLDVSRAISGKLHLDLRAIPIIGVLSRAFEAAGPGAAAKRLALEQSFEPELGDVMGDASRLRQVFDNLLSNAVKFSDSGGRIVMSARRRGDSITVEVRDQGRGIAPEFLPKIFEPFSQVDDALTRTEGGLGLGLAIARQIVGLHGGAVSARSDGPGAGTTFAIELPAMTPDAVSAPAPAPSADRTAPLRGTRILLVDDDQRVLGAIEVLLTRAGATVDAVTSASAGAAALANQPYGVVVSDIAMPGEDGYSFISRLRSSNGYGRSIVAIALTAHVTTADRERALASGFDLHVAKPVDVERLVLNIAELVAKRRSV